MMLKAYYIYSFILWVLMMIMGFALCVYAVHLIKLFEMELAHALYMLCDLAAFLAQIGK